MEIDRLLTQIVEKQRNEMPDEVSVSWAETAKKLNECDYIRENNLSKTSKYCRDRCDPLSSESSAALNRTKMVYIPFRDKRVL